MAEVLPGSASDRKSEALPVCLSQSTRAISVSKVLEQSGPDMPGDGLLPLRTAVPCRAFRPERVEREGDGVEGRERDRVSVGRRGQQRPAAVPQFERLQRPGVRVDGSQVADALAGVDP